jgi:tRNA (cmo5U34)-methyltransferase
MIPSDQDNEVLIYQLKISLKGLIPPIWRKIQLQSDVTLPELHRILQIVMGWGNYHPYRFIIDRQTYGEEPNLKLARETRLSEVVTAAGSKFIYLYDPADDWQHVVKLEKIVSPQAGTSYPLCLAGQRACPPEECGGIWEYTNLLEILKNPEHPEYREMLEQYGGDFDPEAFNVDRVNKALRLVWLANLLPTRATATTNTLAEPAEVITSVSAQWTEADTELYQSIAAVAVPAREEQIASLLTLLPFAAGDSFRAVELGCGQGILSYALLDCFPRVEVLALDGSAAMRAEAGARLNPFASRVSIEPFDLHSADWLPRLQHVDCVISSLVVHHLSGPDKRRLFATICGHLTPRGVLLLADLIEPQRPEARQLFAATWDRSAEAQALAKSGSSQLFEQFIETGWNYYRFPDPFDMPSPLFEQLTWLKAAGLAVVDCFWLQAGHAIYGGYKSESPATRSGIAFEAALRSARRAIVAPE